MSERYGNTAYCRPECERSVPLSGVPTIPDDVHELLKQGIEPKDDAADRSADAIAEACREIQRRHLGMKAGLDVDRYFAVEEAVEEEA